MSISRITVPTGVVAEHVGNELMVFVPGKAEVVKLTGQAADVFLDIQAGRAVRAGDDIVSGLEALGVIEIPGVSRRGLIKAGAIGTGAGIAVLAMPSAAFAASPSIGGFTGEAYWAWLSFGDGNGNYDTGTLRFRIDAPGFITAAPTSLTISGTIPTPAQLVGAPPSIFSSNFSNIDAAGWEADLSYTSPTPEGNSDPLQNFMQSPPQLTGSFSIPGVGPFIVLFDYDYSSV